MAWVLSKMRRRPGSGARSVGPAMGAGSICIYVYIVDNHVYRATDRETNRYL